MNAITRRKLLTTGTAAIAGAAGLAAAAKIAENYGLIPPDHGTLYGAGETLTYACQRVISAHRPMREFPRSMISKPFVSPYGKLPAAFAASQANNFADWRLSVDGLVTHPLSLSVSDLRAIGTRSQITEIACEEGWSYIAEWIGTPLSFVLREAGIKPEARFVAYYCIQHGLWDSVDIDEANHSGTLLAWGMNGGDLPVDYGGPLRIRVPRQIGYKSVKFLTRITAVDSLKHLGKGLGSSSPEYGYAWYAGI
ncbi:MAG TPA: molybdopterin-dependent oxidoreductase [Acidobacteriaceae bacterium]|jgi:DMSO/TMAO reductase YedYZ molybdopterin-dependent catalytic subunit